jgi:hypothetical protein
MDEKMKKRNGLHKKTKQKIKKKTHQKHIKSSITTYIYIYTHTRYYHKES